MGRYKFNNRGTGTIFWLFFFIQWRIQGGGDRDDHPPPPPLELVPLLKTYCKVFVTGTDHPPPLPGMWMASHSHTGNVQGVLVNVQEWGCFSIFRRADDVTQTMSKGRGACGMSSPTPPSPFRKFPISTPVICVKFRANQPLCPPPQPKRPHTPMPIGLLI